MSSGRSLTGSAARPLLPVLRGDPRRGTVVAAFPRAIYLDVDGDLLALVTSDAVALPIAVVLAEGSESRPLARTHVGAGVSVGGGAVDLGHAHVQVRRWWDPRPRLPALPVEALARARPATGRGIERDGVPTTLPAVAARLGAGDPDGALARALDSLGSGPGLTPAADDELAGLVSGVLALATALSPGAGVPAATVTRVRELRAATSSFGVRLAEAARGRTTPISAALLRAAADGAVAGPVATWLHALGHDDQLDTATDAVLAIGATSGRDLLTGLRAAARLLEHAAAGGRVVGRAA